MRKKSLCLLTAALLFLSPFFSANGKGTHVYAANSEYSRQVAALTNEERAANGLGPLQYSEKLTEIANVRAQEILVKFSHRRPDGRDNTTVMDDFGVSYTYFGENIASGYPDPQTVVYAWMDSPSHRANILRRYRYIGVGVSGSDGVYAWVQLFASSKDLSGTVITSPNATSTTSTTSTTATTTTTSFAAAKASSATHATTTAATATTAATTPSAAVTSHQTNASSEPSPSQNKGILERIAAFFLRLFGLTQDNAESLS